MWTLVLVFTFVYSACFISGITSLLARFSIVYEGQEKKFTMLRRCLKHNASPPSVCELVSALHEMAAGVVGSIIRLLEVLESDLATSLAKEEIDATEYLANFNDSCIAKLMTHENCKKCGAPGDMRHSLRLLGMLGDNSQSGGRSPPYACQARQYRAGRQRVPDRFW